MPSQPRSQQVYEYVRSLVLVLHPANLELSQRNTSIAMDELASHGMTRFTGPICTAQHNNLHIGWSDQ